jgi:hypothetical protein
LGAADIRPASTQHVATSNNAAQRSAPARRRRPVRTSFGRNARPGARSRAERGSLEQAGVAVLEEGAHEALQLRAVLNAEAEQQHVLDDRARRRAAVARTRCGAGAPGLHLHQHARSSAGLGDLLEARLRFAAGRERRGDERAQRLALAAHGLGPARERAVVRVLDELEQRLERLGVRRRIADNEQQSIGLAIPVHLLGERDLDALLHALRHVAAAACDELAQALAHLGVAARHRHENLRAVAHVLEVLVVRQTDPQLRRDASQHAERIGTPSG